MLRNSFRIDTIAVMQKRRELLASFDAFWTRLFDSPIHLDSALAKESEASRAELAVVVPKILRAPLALARRAGVRVAPGEPWSLDQAALGRWAPARKIAEALFVESDLSRAEIEGGIEDYPPHFVEEWRRDFGVAAAESLAKTLASPPSLALRASRALGAEEVAARVENATGVRVHRSRASSLGLRLESFARLGPMLREQEGAFEIQDEGSLVLALFALHPETFAPLLTLAPGEPRYVDRPIELPPPPRTKAVIDCCAGAGGKTLAMADALHGGGRVFAYDVSERRLSELKRRAKRAGLTSVKTVVIEEGKERAFAEQHARSASIVLVDAPCSGWGVLKRNPDAKWKQDPSALARLAALQSRLLEAFAPLCAPGGRLIFGACTFRREETIAVTDRFLALHPDFARGPGGYFGPGASSDGFFMQAMLAP